MTLPVADRRPSSLRTVWHAFSLALLLSLMTGPPALAEGKASAAKTNVLLITVDSLRPDHLGCYGYGKPTSPWMDRIAREGTLFQNAFSQGGWTSPAMASIFTGLYPSVHGVEGRNDHFPCRQQSPFSFWEKMGYQVPGYSTIDTESNYSRLGFQPDPDYGFKPEQFTSWLHKHRSQPFFCWYHINKTPHLAYNPPESYRDLFWPKGLNPAVLATERLQAVQSKYIIPKGTLALVPEDRPALLALYDGEVRVADDTVGMLYRLLEEEGLLDATVIVLTADHADELLDHGFIGHASTNWDGTLFDEVVHVPLVIRYPPAFPPGKAIPEVVEAIDLLPTLQETLGLRSESACQGKSLLPLVGGTARDWKGLAFSENSLCGYQCNQVPEKGRVRLASLRSDRWKLVATHAPAHSRFALFDLRADPQEQRDVLPSHPTEGSRLMELLLDTYYRNRLLRNDILAGCPGCQE